MDEDLIKDKMGKVLDILASDIATIRTGRATPAMVQDLSVAVYGGQQKLTVQELATITTPDNQSILIDPWDKSIIGEIRKGIEVANIGLNPVIDQQVIRINIPPMTSEDREKFIKLLGTKLENAKIMIRQIRGEVMSDLKKDFEDKQISEDERFNFEKRLQEITDSFVEKIEEVGKKKKDELQTL